MHFCLEFDSILRYMMFQNHNLVDYKRFYNYNNNNLPKCYLNIIKKMLGDFT